LNESLDNKISHIFQLFFIEGIDMTTNILEASANPMAPTTQQAPDVAIASRILMVSAIPDGVPLDSAISARSSTISVGLAIPIE
jgi:hypothetical protein